MAGDGRTLADAYIRIRPKTEISGSELRGPARQMGKETGTEAGKHFGLSFKSVMIAGVTAATALATGRVVSLLRETVTAASDVAESQNKVAVVFGKSTKAVVDFGKNSATSMGLSKRSYLEAAGTLGNLFVALKLPQAEAAKMSTKMIKLAGDMASFNNVSPEEALEAIRSGLVGETEPLRRFGVNLNEVTIKAQAMKMGLISSTKDALTPAQKATATYALILAQTGTAQNDFARTSTGLANQQRILKAKIDDLKVSIGEKLLPVATRFANWLTTKAVPAVERFIQGMQTGTGAGGRFADILDQVRQTAERAWEFLKNNKEAVLGLVTAFGLATAAVKVFNVTMAITNALMLANPVGLIILGIIASTALLVAPLIFLWTQFESVRDGATIAFNAIKTVVTETYNAVKPLLDDLGRTASSLYTEHIKPTGEGIDRSWKMFAASTQALWDGTLHPIFDSIVRWIRVNIGPTVMWLVNNVFEPGWRRIQIAMDVAWAVMQVIFGLIQIAIKITGGVLEAFYNSTVRPVWAGISALISTTWNQKIKPVLEAFKNYFIYIIGPTLMNFAKVAESAWELVQEVAKKPIRFIVETVLNNNLLRVYNEVARAFHVKPDNVHVSTKGLAKGGQLPGPPSEVDNMLARGPGGRMIGLATGEYVVNARQTKKHLALLHRINSGIGEGYAPGGLVGALTDPVGYVINKAKAKLNEAGTGGFADLAKGAAKGIFTGVTAFLKKLIVSGPLGGGNAGSGTFSTRRGGWPPGNGNQPPWAANVAAAASFIRKTWPGITAGSYVSPHAWSDHYSKAIDNMTNAGNASGLARGNAIAGWFAANPNAFGTKYIIWNRRFTQGGGWGPYSGTDNPHTDHVHLSFMNKGGPVTGMAGGGTINEPIWGVGRSGRRYSFGENGTETVTPGIGGNGGNGVSLVFNVAGDVGDAQVAAIKMHVTSAFAQLQTNITKGRRR